MPKLLEKLGNNKVGTVDTAETETEREAEANTNIGSPVVPTSGVVGEEEVLSAPASADAVDATVTMSTSRVLKTVVFMGSAKDIAPPWGGPSRLGDGVLNYVKSELAKRSKALGDEVVSHDVTVFDPIDVFAKDGALATSGAELRHPHFFFKQGDAPEKMEQMRAAIKAADAFLVVTAEYNHSAPPALLSMLDHFGGSNYAYKPSGIVTYSPGPYGGARAAIALRPVLSELGCLPVSKLACFSSAGEVFNSDGTIKEDANTRQLKMLPDLLSQLEWWAVACLKQKEASGTP